MFLKTFYHLLSICLVLVWFFQAAQVNDYYYTFYIYDYSD